MNMGCESCSFVFCSDIQTKPWIICKDIEEIKPNSKN